MDKKQILLGSAATLAYFADLQHNNLDEYETNEDQYERFINVVKYCLMLEKQYDCELFRCVFNPRWIDGSVEMIFHGDWAVNSEVFHHRAGGLQRDLQARHREGGIQLRQLPGAVSLTHRRHAVGSLII